MSQEALEQNKFKILGRWLLSSWLGVVIIILGAIGTVFSFGFYAGSFITQTEANNTIMNLKFEHQKELIGEREKGKEEALKEMKEKKEEMREVYSIVNGGMQNEK
jgi:uncharacterized membrane protein (DUF106 family)